MEIKVLTIKLMPPERPLKAFIDVRIGDWIIHDFRIVKQNGQKASVLPPQVSWRDPETGAIRFKGVFTIPPDQKQEIDVKILAAYQREMELRSGKQK